MKESVPASYNIQNGCHNCKYVCLISDYDCADSFYCKKFKEPPTQMLADISYNQRLKLGNMILNEICKIEADFRDNCEVEAFGKCDEWEKE